MCTASGSAGSALGEFNEPRGVAFDGGGNIVVADTDSHRVQIGSFVDGLLVNDTEAAPPVGVDDTGATDEDTVLNVAAPGVLDNDTDPNNDPLTVSAV